jgi:HTH-type transcriptional regulator/antitoxin HipB
MSEQSYLSEAIRAARRRAGLSQAELAAALGVRQSSVSQWERGSTRPSTGHLLALTSILRTTLLDFSAVAAGEAEGAGGGASLAVAASGAEGAGGSASFAVAAGGAEGAGEGGPNRAAPGGEPRAAGVGGAGPTHAPAAGDGSVPRVARGASNGPAADGEARVVMGTRGER